LASYPRLSSQFLFPINFPPRMAPLSSDEPLPFLKTREPWRYSLNPRRQQAFSEPAAASVHFRAIFFLACPPPPPRDKEPPPTWHFKDERKWSSSSRQTSADPLPFAPFFLMQQPFFFFKKLVGLILSPLPPETVSR